jgi:chromodomain-helicase-DNA-binding protein 4
MASDDNQDFSPASEDADEFVADLLQQFSSVSGGAKEPATKSAPLTSIRNSFRAVNARSSSSASPSRESTIVAVEVPPPRSDVEYERLPGYSTARNVLRQKYADGESLYQVELQNREKEWVS